MRKYIDLRDLNRGADVTTDFNKDYLEKALGRTFSKVQDGASKYEEDGKTYSFLLELGSGNASTRFQTWVTQRKAARIDLYIGNAFISDGTINIDTLSDYRKGNDRGAGNEYRNVPLYKVIEFFVANELTTENSVDIVHANVELTEAEKNETIEFFEVEAC